MGHVCRCRDESSFTRGCRSGEEPAGLKLSDDTDEPDTYLQRLQEKVAYAGHPYLNRPEGTAESITRLSAEDLRAYHKSVMQTSRLLLVVVAIWIRPSSKRASRPRSQAAARRLQSAGTAAINFNSSSLDVTSRTLPTNYIQGFYTAHDDSPDIYPMYVASSLRAIAYSKKCASSEICLMRLTRSCGIRQLTSRHLRNRRRPVRERPPCA